MAVVMTLTPACEPSAAGTPYSSMASVKASSRLAAMAGSASGRVTRRNARQGPAPNTRATSASRAPVAAMLRDTAKYTTGKIASPMASVTPAGENSSGPRLKPASCSR
ncbi:hypothetical protein LMG3412_05860 [Achromobacter deleyi]|nr:hypothetical protein LMG3412_05860 [Achromobacter deleyi]